MLDKRMEKLLEERIEKMALCRVVVGLSPLGIVRSIFYLFSTRLGCHFCGDVSSRGFQLGKSTVACSPSIVRCQNISSAQNREEDIAEFLTTSGAKNI